MINIGRATSGGAYRGLFGNPFIVGRHGTLREVLRKYRTHVRFQMLDPYFVGVALRIRHKDFLCPGCGINAPNCHGAILRDEINKYRILGQREYINYHVPPSVRGDDAKSMNAYLTP